jgi:hypothetical protein
MIFTEGTEVSYKNISGVIAFATEESISILVREGKHRSQDVRVVVSHLEFKDIILLNGK